MALRYLEDAAVSPSGLGLAEDDRWCDEEEMVLVFDRSCFCEGIWAYVDRTFERRWRASFLLPLLALLCHEALITSVWCSVFCSCCLVRWASSSIFAWARARRSSTARLVCPLLLLIDDAISDADGIEVVPLSIWRERSDLGTDGWACGWDWGCGGEGFAVEGTRFERCRRRAKDLFMYTLVKLGWEVSISSGSSGYLLVEDAVDAAAVTEEERPRWYCTLAGIVWRTEALRWKGDEA